jgi:histidine ammonia-lyase
MVEIAMEGRIASRRPESKARLAATQRRQALAGWNWNPASPPAWLTEEVYSERIQPRLRGASLSAIAQVGVSIPYASAIRRGRRRPHARHWQALAELIGMGQAG